MKNIIIVCLLLFASCKTSKNILKSEIKKDSISVSKSNIEKDVIIEKRSEKITEPTSNKISIPCKDGNFSQTLKVGGVDYTITVKDGNVDLFVNTKENKCTSSEKLTENSKNKLEEKSSIKESVVISKMVIKPKEKKSFFQKIEDKFWQVAFCIIFVLYILLLLGFNPFKFIIKLIKP